MKIEQKEITKTRLIIYVLMAYGLTCLMWYGSTKGRFILKLQICAQEKKEYRESV